ncbi:formate/nitrite transporter family protein [Dysgonomonas sp. GY617]|uniref:formate/nitrite transporter family protein n=1 Tax=Dysgonomonas sp. GY617 TaxID=2780420 RepID=UPI001883D739|nr:formate/nitrite transporter family protein [Dysgonomonas sp. GY617]MBF0576877.1 formate/nitrite transporter family protein [Dysgonomonas sp. GY617]
MSNYYNPREITLLFAESATYKRNIPFIKFCILSILGGMFIAFGGLLSIMVSGGMPGIGAANPGLVKFVAGALFPVGLIMVSITGADLFTSNCAGFCFPLLQRKINVSIFFKYLLLSYLFNFIGTQFIAFVLSYEVGLLDKQPWQTYLHHYSEVKVSQDFFTIFIKGIGANWLVCLGVFMGYAAKDITGRCIGIWIPVMLFVTLGYEHSIANMFFIPAAIYSGADITWGSFLIQNLIPSTLGNLVGGAGFIGCVYGYLYLKEE